MEMAVRQLAALIKHLRLESLQEQTRCFYCGGLHRTVECDSPRRDAFMMNLAERVNSSNMAFDPDLHMDRYSKVV